VKNTLDGSAGNAAREQKKSEDRKSLRKGKTDNNKGIMNIKGILKWEKEK